MKLTEALKKYAQEKLSVAEDASDEDYRKAISDALATGTLSPAEYAKLSTTEEQKAANSFEEGLSQVNSNLEKLTALMTAEKKSSKEEKEEKAETKETKDETKEEKASRRVERPLSPLQKVFRMTSSLDGEEEEKGFDVIVKEAADQYSDTKKTLTFPSQTKSGRAHPLAGQPVRDFTDGGRVIDEASDLDMAICGAYSQFSIARSQSGGSRALAFQRLPQHSKELLCFALQKREWVGASDGGNTSDIKGFLSSVQQKDLIDDSTSGGTEAAPIVFDDMVIQTPLLYGELFPMVNTISLDRGRRVEGVSTGTVTGAWGGVDATAITLFTTTSYVSAFDTTIFRWQGAIRIGLDFLSDTPIDFGAHVTAQYGERLLEDLDDVIAAGNGTTQPEGVINKSGTTSVTFSGSTSIGNYESLRFGVAKPEFRGPVGASAVFCGTETSYQRARAIPVGASDARRLFGMNHFGADSYSLMDAPYKINESLTNAQIFFAVLGRYRMYRRRGLTMRTSTEGDTLIRNNELLITATARYGGQLERGAAAAVTTDAPA